MAQNVSSIGGFTLIELLIVIAIILILIAIALPNFLEAMTRAKVTRVYAEMHTCATILESYYADHNSYPSYGGREDLINPAPQLDGGPHFLPWRLTTPIAYTTSLFMEVFSGENTPMGCPQLHELHYFNRKQSPAWWSGNGSFPEPPYNHERFWHVYFGVDGRPFHWYLASNGPDLWCDGAGLEIYSATNGTTSRGDLVWFGPSKGRP
jgi:prepilin-type N-terminal cleavage/methylation domain-containing protein